MLSKFEIAYQPIVCVNRGTVHHFEALARFPHGCGRLSPGDHIVFAERQGKIIDFDRSMTERVLAVLVNAAPFLPMCRIAVNISGHSIISPLFHQSLDELIECYAPAPDRLLFEITETARITDLAEANESIQRLRRHGFPVCLDDFGSGAADFEYLSALDVDIVKIDGCALRRARRQRKGAAFMRALSGLCRELGVATVAETVDDEDFLRFVRDCGFNFVQGFLFGEPSPDIAAFPSRMSARLFPH